MARKIFHETKMQGGNIYRPCKGKENVLALLKQRQAQKGATKQWMRLIEIKFT